MEFLRERDESEDAFHKRIHRELQAALPHEAPYTIVLTDNKEPSSGNPG